jgi:hypothetical protein
VHIRRIIGFIAAAVLTTTGADAQIRSNTSKFFVNFGVNGTSISGNEDDLGDERRSGGGLSLGIGYGFTSRFAIFLDGSAASVDGDGGDFVLSHGDLGARLHFSDQSKKLIPYLEVALTARSASPESLGDDDEAEDIEISGTGLTVGGGILYFFNPRWAFNAGLKWSTGEFDKVRVGNVTVDGLEIDATSTRLNLGLSWFPMGSR